MKTPISCCRSLMLLLVVTVAPAARAAIIVTTYDGTTTGTASNISSNSGKAVGFTMPAGPSYTLDSIGLVLSSSAATKPTAGQITLAIYGNDGSNTPGTLLDTLTTPSLASLSSTPALFTFTPTSAFTFTTSTAYWIALTSGTSNLLTWHTSAGNTHFSSTIGATYLGAMFGSGAASGWTSTSSVRNALSIDAVVPEPAVLPLLGGALLLVGGRGPRRCAIRV